MPSGDSFALFLGLLFFAGGTGVAAYSISGPKSRHLGAVAGITALAAVAYLIFQSRIGIAPARLFQWLLVAMPFVTVSLVAVMISSLRKEMNEVRALPNAAPQQTSSAADRRAAALNFAAQRVSSLKYDARNVILRRGGSATSVLASMESLMTTLHKTFGVETPVPQGTPTEKLKVFAAYLDAVWPFLRDGNYEQGQARAITFIAERKLEMDQ